MSTRREFAQTMLGVGAAFAVTGRMVLDDSPAYARPADFQEGHFHPKGKPPSRFTIEALERARATLPFSDTRDFEEQQRGLIWGWHGGWGGVGMSTTTQQTWDEGTLVLALFETTNKDMVWTASATADLDQDASPDQRQKQIDDAVSKMMADFPPGS